VGQRFDLSNAREMERGRSAPAQETRKPIKPKEDCGPLWRFVFGTTGIEESGRWGIRSITGGSAVTVWSRHLERPIGSAIAARAGHMME
jgi:hypothetical protein